MSRPRGVEGVRRRWERRVARLVANAMSPPVMVSAAVATRAVAASEAHVWRWASFYVLFSVVSPLAYLVYRVRQGKIPDFDIRRRRQRLGPQLFTVGCFGASWALLRAGAAPVPLLGLATLLFVHSVAVFGITLRWKISVHSAMAAGTGVLLWSTFGMLVPIALMILAVAWSRLRLEYHTPGQTLAGVGLGLLVFAPALAVLP